MAGAAWRSSGVNGKRYSRNGESFSKSWTRGNGWRPYLPGTRDRKLRALDKRNGKVLWEAELPAATEGMPAVYELQGREYIAVCASAQATTHTHDLPGHPADRRVR